MIDLHTQTKASDGEKTPEDLIDLAISKKIKALAITDHDTIDSIERAVNYAQDKDIMLIPGIEFEAHVQKGQMHILGLFIDYKNKQLIEKLNFIKQARDIRNEKFIEEFNKLGFEITLEELKRVSNGKIIGKPHFAKIFLEKNYISEREEMFNEYFNKSPFKELPKALITPKEVIELIKNAGGLAILAHPQSLKLEKNELRDKIQELKEYGLDGLECYHSKQTIEEMELFKQIAEEKGLLITKGSDYHRDDDKKKRELGTGTDRNIVVDNEIVLLEKILNKLEEVSHE